MSEKRKIDVEESKRLGRIVTKEIDESDPDYEKYPDKVEYVDDFYIGDGFVDYSRKHKNEYRPSKGIEIYFTYLFLVFFSIPISFVILKAFITGGNLEFIWKMIFYVGYVVIYSLMLFLVPIIALKRKDISLYHKKIIRIVMGNNLVLLLWNTVFVITPVAMNIDIPVGKAKTCFLLYFFLAISDIVIQIIINRLKEKYREKEEMLERISLVLSIITIWGYGAIICPLIFSKTIERVIFDISLFVFVGLMSVINLIVYKSRKKKVEEDYVYKGEDYYLGTKMLTGLILEGVLVGIICLFLIGNNVI